MACGKSSNERDSERSKHDENDEFRKKEQTSMKHPSIYKMVSHTMQTLLRNNSEIFRRLYRPLISLCQYFSECGGLEAWYVRSVPNFMPLSRVLMGWHEKRLSFTPPITGS